ncbi:MAG: HAMP domain-containing histidine kinase [Clostridiales bacterium]|nr:HAMP domain-containing histidine kinase [Clostridiales bacterium]
MDISYEQSTLAQAAVNVLLVGLAALAVLFVISVFLARWAVRPVERSWAQQRQFVADASHELKTPLTVILSNADLLEEEEGLSEQARPWTENIHTGGAQMREPVEQLLLLARSDSDQGQPMSLQPTDLSDLAETAALMFEPVAFEAGKLLVQEIQKDVVVAGDAARLKRLLDILLDNAVKYAAPRRADPPLPDHRGQAGATGRLRPGDAHGEGGAGAHLPAVLPGGRGPEHPGLWPGALHRPEHRPGAPRQAVGGVRPGGVEQLLLLPAAGVKPEESASVSKKAFLTR